MYRFIYMFMVVMGILLIYITMRQLIKRRMTEVNSILWFLIGFVTILAGCFPKIVTYLAGKLDIQYSPAFVFMLAILLLLLIVFENTVAISGLTAQVQEMALELSIMEEELQQLKQQLKIEQEKQQEKSLKIEQEKQQKQPLKIEQEEQQKQPLKIEQKNKQENNT